MSPLTRLTNIQLSLIHVNPLSDVPILDTLMSFAYVRRHASFPLASHLAVSSNAVRVGYTVVRFNRVRIELTFYHYSLKRTHNLGLDSGPNFRWQYSSPIFKGSLVPHRMDFPLHGLLVCPSLLQFSQVGLLCVLQRISRNRQTEKHQ